MRKCLKKGSIVAIAVCGSASVKTLSRFAKDLLEEMGSEEISKLDYGQSWAFVGVFGEKNRSEKREKEEKDKDDDADIVEGQPLNG